MGDQTIASEAREAFAAGDFKRASLLLTALRELMPDDTLVQSGDGTVQRKTGANEKTGVAEYEALA